MASLAAGRVWGGLCAVVLGLLNCGLVGAQPTSGVPLDICGDLRMKAVVTNNCTFYETPDVEYTPGESVWNWLWAHKLPNDMTSWFEATFELDQVRGDLWLTVAHLTASQWEDGAQVGYDPVAYTVNDEDGDPFNGTNLAVHRDTNEPAQAFDVASHHDARFGPETDTFILPARYLRVGTNTVRWTRGVARSSHRVQAFRIYTPSKGRFQFASQNYQVDEAGRAAVLRVLRQDGWEGEVSVRFRAVALTAKAGSDYEDISGVLTFGPHEQSQTIAIPIKDDSAAEGPETFEMRLSDPSSGCILGSPTTVTVTIVDDETQPAVLYVDRDAKAGGDGRGWKTALNHLQDALATARLSKGVWQEIWVAEGTYAPGTGANSQEASFELVDGVGLYGGFKGTETARSQRDPLLHPTLLSGDLQGDDRPGYANTSDNAYHVVRAQDVGAATILDGFTIQGGYTTTLYGEYTSVGGGLFLRHASPVVRNCTIQGNRAMDGAGAFCYDLSYPVFEACSFEHNLIDVPITGGAGLSNRTSSPLLLNCTFIGNLCLGAGGAMCNYDSSPVALHCTFCWNTAAEFLGRGGAFCTIGTAFDTRPVLRNCILASNFAHEGTQFMFLGTSSLYVEHSIIEDTGSMTWIEAYRQAGLERGPGVDDRDIQLTPDGHLISGADARGGLVCNAAVTDIDGDTRAAGPVTLGADVWVDSDGDGLPDVWERQWFGGATAADPNGDADGDGITNLDEFQLYGSNPRRLPLYVEGSRGNDLNNGSQSQPKRTIQGGLDAAQPGDTILLAPGTYAGPGNVGISFLGRQVVVRGMDKAPDATVVDCNNAGFAFRFADGETPASALANLSVSHGWTEIGAAVQCHMASPLLANCRILDSVGTVKSSVLTLGSGQGYDFSTEAVTDPNLGDVGYADGWFKLDALRWEIIDLGPTPLMALGQLPDAFAFEAWLMGAWNSDEMQAVAGHSYAIRTMEYERYALVHVLAASPEQVTVEWLYVNAKSWPGEYRTGGLSVFLGAPRLTGCVIQDNRSAGLYVQSGGLSLAGDLRIVGNDIDADWALFQGSGRLVLDAGTTWQADRVFLRCNVAGPGTIHVADGSELRVEHKAVVNLTVGGLTGSMVCDGQLLLKDQVVLRDTHIQVNRLSVDDEVRLDNCVIQAEAGAPFGQFYVSGQATVDVPSIFANGDRYLDVDPRTFDCNNLRVDRVDVVDDEGIGQATGGLFELRGLDLLNVPWEPNVYVYPVAKAPDFGPQTWTVDRLELVAGARLNLTNRFDFQAPFDQNGGQEVLFVRDLILGDGAILNTAFNRVYCERLVKAGTAQIISIPLLGFSLNNISFDDARDFSTRVKTNNALAVDLGQSDLFISRVVGQTPDPAGMMRMRNLVIDNSVVHARAQGLFAKASEKTIEVRFEYLFESAEGRIAVTLTDSPEMLNPGQPGWKDHYSLVGYVDAPPQGRPGSAGSGTLATFGMQASTAGLDFYRGVRIELELIGPAGTSVLINNWDPLVQANSSYCGDVVYPANGADVFDFLAVMSETGRGADQVMSASGAPMGDALEGFFCKDGYVTALDAMAANWYIGRLDCPVGDPVMALASKGAALQQVRTLSQAGTAGSVQSSGSVMVVGKRYSVVAGRADEFLAEGLYGLDSSGPAVSCAGSSPVAETNVRLVRGPDQGLYRVNLRQGLVRLDTAQTVVLGSRSFSTASEPRYGRAATVYAGVQSLDSGVAGFPILDAAFDSAGDLYVVPVWVSPDGNSPYVAAARLSRGLAGAWTLVQVYVPQMRANDNIHLEGLREVEVDQAGRVYVLNVARANHSDAVLVFDARSGQETGRYELYSLGIEAPAGMQVSADVQRLYIGGAGVGKGCPCVVTLPVAALQGTPVDLVPAVQMEIRGMGQVTDIAEDPGTGVVWAVGITLHDIPSLFDSNTMLTIENQSPFYSAYVASFARDQAGPVQASLLTGPACDMVLPMAIEANPSSH